jgi:hypothetical protein
MRVLREMGPDLARGLATSRALSLDEAVEGPSDV